MQRQAQKLTIDEKQNADLQREIYVLIRLIDVIEKCAQLSDDRITPDEHQKQMSKLLEKLQVLQKKVPGFNLNSFIAEYGLDDCKFGIDRITSGPPKVQQNQTNQIQLVKDLAQLFFQFQDVMLNVQDNPEVSQLRSLTESLIDLLSKAVQQLPPYNSYLKELQDFYQRIMVKKYVMDILSEQEYKELSTLLDLAQKNFLLNK